MMKRGSGCLPVHSALIQMRLRTHLSTRPEGDLRRAVEAVGVGTGVALTLKWKWTEGVMGQIDWMSLPWAQSWAGMTR